MGRNTKTDAQRVLDKVTRFYLQSDRFNGLELTTLATIFSWTLDRSRTVVRELVDRRLVALASGENHPNPHIKALDPVDVDRQLQSLSDADPHHVCIYPEAVHLKQVVKIERYQGRPYTLRLALGEPQLRHAVFDLTVLECYRNDPRYRYEHNDVQGSISASHKTGRVTHRQRDRVLLETFGFAYNRQLDRAVASFLWYLSTLTREHQEFWRSKELRGKYLLHPEYYRTSILGEWPEKESVFVAFLEEIRVINAMARAINRPVLFRREIELKDRPREFAFLIRPTLKEFNDFVQVLDKLLSDNLDIAFFQGEVDLDEKVERSDSRLEVKRKGSLSILEEWLRLRFKPRDPESLSMMFTAFRNVRRLRSPSVHKIDDNEFSPNYFRKQRKLIIDAYGALRTLRLIIANHPGAQFVKVPGWLAKGEICFY